jgi:Protein of unknown function (DUF3313)
MFTISQQSTLTKRCRTPLARIGFALCLVLSVGCEPQPQTGNTEKPSSPARESQADSGQIVLRKMPADKEFSGFLKDYSNVKPNPRMEGNALTFIRADAEKNLHRYIAMIVNPVQVYLASDADESKLPEKARGVGARYFHRALVGAVSSAFTIVDQPGPLVLRLRSAIVGVDVGGEVAAADKPSDPDDAIGRTVNIGKVGVEMELVDSDTGEQIAAMVDRENLGKGAEIGAVHFSRQEKWRSAQEAFDGWAGRVREFLDSAHQLSADDIKRADQSYKPYGEEPR